MREVRSTLSSCGVGEEYSEYRGWRERQTYMDHREHQTGMDTGAKGAKGCIKLLWARGWEQEERWMMAWCSGE